MCKSSFGHVKFRVKSIKYIFFKFPFSMALVYTFIKRYEWRLKQVVNFQSLSKLSSIVLVEGEQENTELAED